MPKLIRLPFMKMALPLAMSCVAFLQSESAMACLTEWCHLGLVNSSRYPMHLFPGYKTYVPGGKNNIVGSGQTSWEMETHDFNIASIDRKHRGSDWSSCKDDLTIGLLPVNPQMKDEILEPSNIASSLQSNSVEFRPVSSTTNSWYARGQASSRVKGAAIGLLGSASSGLVTCLAGGIGDQCGPDDRDFTVRFIGARRSAKANVFFKAWSHTNIWNRCDDFIPVNEAFASVTEPALASCIEVCSTSESGFCLPEDAETGFGRFIRLSMGGNGRCNLDHSCKPGQVLKGHPLGAFCGCPKPDQTYDDATESCVYKLDKYVLVKQSDKCWATSPANPGFVVAEACTGSPEQTFIYKNSKIFPTVRNNLTGALGIGQKCTNWATAIPQTAASGQILTPSLVDCNEELKDDSSTCAPGARCPTLMLANNRACGTQLVNGNIAVIDNGNVTRWKTNAPAGGVAPFYWSMQVDGNLVIYDATNKATWSSGTNGKGNSPWTLRMQDDCNLVIYDKLGSPTWASGTNTATFAPDEKSPTISPTLSPQMAGAAISLLPILPKGKSLIAGEKLESMSGNHYLKIADDRNYLCVYKTGATDPLGCTGTRERISFLRLPHSGNPELMNTYEPGISLNSTRECAPGNERILKGEYSKGNYLSVSESGDLFLDNKKLDLSQSISRAFDKDYDFSCAGNFTYGSELKRLESIVSSSISDPTRLELRQDGILCLSDTICTQSIGPGKSTLPNNEEMRPTSLRLSADGGLQLVSALNCPLGGVRVIASIPSKRGSSLYTWQSRLYLSSEEIFLNDFVVNQTPTCSSPVVTVGTTFRRKDAIFSPNGNMRLILQDDGNLCVKDVNGNGVCTMILPGQRNLANDERLRPEYLIFTTDGQLELKTSRGCNAGGSRLLGFLQNKSGSTLSLTNDGTIMLGTSAVKVNVDFVATANAKCDASPEFVPGSNLLAGQSLYSGDDQYRLVLQGDGNLCVYLNYSQSPVCTMIMPGQKGIAQNDESMRPSILSFSKDNKLKLYSTNRCGRGGRKLVGELAVPAGRLVVENSGALTVDGTQIILGNFAVKTNQACDFYAPGRI